MRYLGDMINQQQLEVAGYRQIAARFVQERVEPLANMVGALLSGSVARGDARKAPLGLLIDVVVVLDDGTTLDLSAALGPNRQPALPFHCVTFGDAEIAIEVRELSYLLAVRERQESEMFARNESIVLHDPTGVLSRWKQTAFRITPDEVRTRCLRTTSPGNVPVIRRPERDRGAPTLSPGSRLLDGRCVLPAGVGVAPASERLGETCGQSAGASPRGVTPNKSLELSP